MNVAEYLVCHLVKNGVRDAFGIPGGVILDFIYALEANPAIQAHLCFHEQGAVFAACGNAQVNGRLGAAYATRGPGVANMFTGIADAYYDSIPILVITAHACKEHTPGLRITFDQEMDTVSVFSSVTKGIIKIEHADEAAEKIKEASQLAMDGRKGPVILDVYSGLWSQEIRNIGEMAEIAAVAEAVPLKQDKGILKEFRERLENAKRPVFLIGDGIRQSGMADAMRKLLNQVKIPVISSRAAQDIAGNMDTYYGYIGSHGIRYSNFILAKSDLIIAIGNRMSYPLASESYRTLMNDKNILRIDADSNEFSRKIPNSINIQENIARFLPFLLESGFSYEARQEWMNVCSQCRDLLKKHRITYPIEQLMELLCMFEEQVTIVSDVGNHEFWLSQAYTLSQAANRVLYSKSFGVLGCALAKAIGVCYETGNTVLCICGDQGFQMNIQELQTIVSNHLPIVVVIVNNASSGMIRSQEKKRYGGYYVQTTLESGYSMPSFEDIAKAYKLDYVRWSEGQKVNVSAVKKPCIIEMTIDENYDLESYLPKGNKIQNMEPSIDADLYEYLEAL